MGLICFDKPKKTRPSEEHNVISSDNLIPGNYAPNMSQEDIKKWKGKITGTKRGYPQIEIRKNSFVL